MRNLEFQKSKNRKSKKAGGAKFDEDSEYLLEMVILWSQKVKNHGLRSLMGQNW